MTTADSESIIFVLQSKSFFKLAGNIKRLTDYLQDRIDFGNKHLLKGFQYRLVMEEEV